MGKNAHVIGEAGTGLVHPDWAANEAVAAQGRRGELRTGEILNAYAAHHPVTILHDLWIPIPGFSANIDHAVVAGRRVWLIDSKNWAPAFYWTLNGQTRRGWKRFEVRRKDGGMSYPAESQTMPMAYRALTTYLLRHAIIAQVMKPLIVVWPSRDERMSLTFLRMSPSEVVRGDQFARRAKKLFGAKAANEAVVAALTQLVNRPGAPASARGRSGDSNLVDW